MQTSRAAVSAAVVLVALLLLVGLPVGSRAAPPVRSGGVLAHMPPLAHASSGGAERGLAGMAPMVACLGVPRGAPCYASTDQPVVDLISNASGSGSRFTLTIRLPGAGTNPASALANFWVGLWVTGAPCSVDSAAYLKVQLFPPDSPSISPLSPNWTVRAPVEDLAPSGSCDPLCQNATSVTSVGGVPVCEDNIVRGGGAPPSPSTGSFAPGDQVRITVWGSAGSPSPLSAWANDTTRPSESVVWSYNGNDTTTGLSISPRYDVSNDSDGGWSTPTDVAFGWTDCPSAPGVSVCNSYDGPAVGAVGLPTATGAEFWNGSSASMESYPWIATASTSGACAGTPPMPPCSNFQALSGTGVYPSLQIVRSGTGSAWRVGGSTNVVSDYGGAAAEFAPSGVATALVPSDVLVASANGSAGTATVNLTAADPRGVEAVRAETYWCNGVGPALVQASAAPAVPGATLSNLSVVLNVSSENGLLTYWVSERANGSTWTPWAPSNLTMTGGTGNCVVPPPSAPGFGSANVSAVAGGYRLNWTESSAGISGFTVNAKPLSAGVSTVEQLGDVGSATILGLSPSEHYNLTVTAQSLERSTSASSVLPSGTPLAPLSFTVGAVGGPIWHGSPSTKVNVTISGGAAPYQILANLGNGTTVRSNTSLNATAVPVVDGSAVGVVSAQLTVTDADGVVASVAPLVWDVWTGPLAPSAKLNAGDGAVGVTWTPSVSPAAPVLGYVVYLTSDPVAPSSAYRVGDDNTSASSPLGAVEVWNSTSDALSVLWPDNVTVYAVVVPVDVYGSGFATAPALSATPAPISIGPISGGPGGPAPFTAQYSTLVTTGTNDSIDEAVYSFPGFAFLPANTTPDGPRAVWMNVTATISTLGLDVILLHVSDAFGGTAIGATSVWVSTGAAPGVSAQANPAPAYVGVVVKFQASATGTGPFAYDWTFGDGTNGTGSTANHSYGTAGTFTATVVVTDNGTGARTSAVVPETVYTLPRVAIVVSPGPDGSESFAFHGLLYGGAGNGSFVWAFGDGSTGRGENVTHDYTSPGDVIVNVTATDASLRTAFGNISVAVPSTGGGGSGSGSTFSPIAEVAIVAAAAGWLVAAVLIVRSRADARAAAEDDDDEFDEV